MTEPLYIFMERTDETPSWYVTTWRAVLVPGHGRTFTRAHAETLAAQRDDTRERFLLPFSVESHVHGSPEGTRAMALEMLAHETIWMYGVPLRFDLIAVLRTVAQELGALRGDCAKLPVRAVVDHAMQSFGQTESHDVEAHFDDLVLRLGGRRAGEPPAYELPTLALTTI